MTDDHEGAALLSWVILTMGDRPDQLARAVDSLGPEADVVVVLNGSPGEAVEARIPAGVQCVVLEENRGVPAGRNAGLEAASGDIIGFLDDDAAVLTPGATARIVDRFDRDPQLAVLALRLVDEDGRTARRHVPRMGRGDPDRSGPVGYFLGGASAIRRSDFEAVGAYDADLFYGHEELDLAWRILDQGRTIRYAADVRIFHPPTEIDRHPQGWFRTGRNRVVIARRNLPQPVALIHVLFWLALGWWRAPGRDCRGSYLRGWRQGWRVPVDRHPVGWSTVWRLTRLGRPPVV